MNQRLLVLFLILPISHGAAGPLAAQGEGELTRHDLQRVLQTRIDMKDFQNPMTLKEALGLLYEKVAASGMLGKGEGLPILLAQASFHEVDPKAPDIYESTVKFPPYPKTLTIATALRVALSQAAVDATFVIRRGFIEVVPPKHAALEFMLKEKVLAEFHRKPLLEAIRELADRSGVSIQVDGRVAENPQQTVTASFHHDISVRDALFVLTDMAGLKIVELPTTLYVTSPANAVILRGELANERTKSLSK
jgi:hypothetical protein